MADRITALKTARLVKPGLDTPFHIDFDWWERTDRNMRVYMRSHLCPTHHDMYSDTANVEHIDWVDPKTGEIKQVDGLMYQLRAHCSHQKDYITSNTSLVDAIFRVFLVNGNQPLSPRELGEKIGKVPDLILKTIGGHTVYRGLRPYLD